ncbi:NAD(P)H-dependent oxidoreductase [Candidatus Peregrinibacteria bacterium]|nr:NAD(P)H-dependent oxidoreductase [Candidatus Peregrinibacteria bacterium]
MKILVLVAGTNEQSNSNTLADAFIEGIKETYPEIEVIKYRLKDLNIKHFTLERYIPACPRDDDFCNIQDALLDSKGVVIASPIWNFSVPAHLKNVIDRIGAVALDEETRSRGQMKAKPFYIIFTGGAPLLAWKALMYLTTMHVSEAIKYYGGVVVGKYFEPRAMLGKGKFGLVVDQRPKSLERVKNAGKKFAKIVKTYAETGTLPLRIRLSYQFFSFVYRVGNRIMYPISTKQ